MPAWVAERTAAVSAFMEGADEQAGVWPVTREIVAMGRDYSAVDAFGGQYELADLRRTPSQMADLDFALPTAPTIYRVMISSASRCSTTRISAITNQNFFGLSALALPRASGPTRPSFGITWSPDRTPSALLAFRRALAASGAVAARQDHCHCHRRTAIPC